MNARAIDLTGQGIGYMPLENLLTEEDLGDMDKEALFDLIPAMQEDGMSMRELVYRDGSRRLLFYIE